MTPTWSRRGPRKRAPRRGRWSSAEMRKLIELYGTREDAAIARLLGRSVTSVRRMAEGLFAASGRSAKVPASLRPAGAPRREWTASEERRLKLCIGVASLETISRILRRSPADVEAKVDALRSIRRSGDWSVEEIRDLKALFGSRDDDVLALVFARPVAEIREVADRLCLAKDKVFLRKSDAAPGKMRRWTLEEMGKLAELYASASNLEIARELKRTIKSVIAKASEMRLGKSPEQRARANRWNVEVRYGRRGAELERAELISELEPAEA